MFDFGEQLAGFDLTGAALLPGWVLALAATVVVLGCAIGAIRGGFDLRSVSAVPIAVVFIVAITVAWVLDHWAARDLAAERRAVDGRAFELRIRALTPGSALACLDATAGEMVQDFCEKALFASPEATAGAVSYVTAQLSLLATARKHALASGLSYAKVLPTLRRAIEIDRFGIVAYLFAMRPGCRPKECDLFVLLQDSSRVRANLADRRFESYLKTHMADWPAAGSRPVASNHPPDSGSPGAPAPTAAAKPPSNLFFPSASSIPSVNIMTAEPAAAQQPNETTASADPAARTRRPPQGARQERQPPGADSGQARSAPLQIAPPAQ
jgi:hypothetical protein